MKSLPSSFRADAAALPWWRQPWPWLLIAGPLIVVFASMASFWIAYKTDDGVVATDYYKRGLLVNRMLPKVPVALPRLAATVFFGSGGELRVRPEEGDVRGDVLRVTLTHPASATKETLTLARDADGEFVGTVHGDRTGLWTISFDSADWPLPTTLLERSSRPGPGTHVTTSPSIR
ncbi:MAG TPA: FixH family protein [Casimicrobiaceae bacterium]|nr:FixH family protein [Casimicrobiaceae bacterium]